MVEQLFDEDGRRGSAQTESTSVHGDHYHWIKSLEKCRRVRNVDTLLNGCAEDFDLDTSTINSGIPDIKVRLLWVRPLQVWHGNTLSSESGGLHRHPLFGWVYVLKVDKVSRCLTSVVMTRNSIRDSGKKNRRKNWMPAGMLPNPTIHLHPPDTFANPASIP